MTTFTGNGNDNFIDAPAGDINGFTGGTLAQLQDLTGDTIRGGSGNDFIRSGDGDDLIEGGFDSDTLQGSGGNDTIYANTQTDPDGSIVGDYMDGGLGNDSIIGSSGHDTIFGGFGIDVVLGGAGNDSIKIRDGELIDDIDAGFGIDTFDLSLISSSGASIDLNAGFYQRHDLLGGTRAIQSAEVIIGTQNNDVIVSDFSGSVINGQDGDDVLVILDGQFLDFFDGDDGIDTADFSRFDVESAVVNLGANTWSVAGLNSEILANVENILAGGGNDLIIGSTVANNLNGGFGDDTIDGGDGNDTVDGYFGADSLQGGGGNDLMQGGFGADFIRGGDGNDTIYAVSSTASNEAAFNTLFGDAGSDSMIGADGNDFLDGGTGNDTMAGGLGDDRLEGGDGNDLMRGGGGNDIMNGGVGNDRMFGDAGDDVLTGGIGRDVMVGGQGFDSFDFNSVAESGVTAATRDVIVGFQAGSANTTIDRIDLSTIDANELVGGNQSFVFGGPFTAGHIRATQGATFTLLEFNTDGDAAAEMTIQLNNVLLGNLNINDFIL